MTRTRNENYYNQAYTEWGLLFELKQDPTVKSAYFNLLVKKTIGEEASVRALSQESVIESGRNHDQGGVADVCWRRNAI